MYTVASTPAERAANATAWAWLPAARAAGLSDWIVVYAPRILNEPVRCWFSNFSHTSPPQRRVKVSERSVGVRWATPDRPSAAARMSSSVTTRWARRVPCLPDGVRPTRERDRRDPPGESEQVRVRLAAGPDRARPDAVDERRLPRRLRLRHAHARPRRRPRRRARARRRADLSGLRDQGRAGRRVRDARREGRGRQGALRPVQGSEVEPRPRHRRHPRVAARRDR